MNSKPRKLIIIGSGPAGLTAGIYAARANLEPLIFEGDKPGGQLMGTSYVENWPGNEKILGPELMMNMHKHAQAMGCTFIAETINQVDFRNKPFTLISTKGREYCCHACIIATGARSRRLDIPGEAEYWGKGVSTCAVCDAAFYRNKKVIVIGGGDTAMEDASFLNKFTNDITIIQNQDELTASVPMQKRILDNPDINIMYNRAVTAVIGNENHLTGIKIIDQKTQQSEEIKADGIFLAVGMIPHSKPFDGQLKLDRWGYIKVCDHTKTSAEGVFAAGDIADPVYRQAITSAGSGCMAALDAERYLTTLKN